MEHVLFLFFIVGSLIYISHPWSNEWWTRYWHITSIWMPLVLGVLTTIWFTIGGIFDLRVFFRRLREERVDVTDDGTVRKDQKA